MRQNRGLTFVLTLWSTEPWPEQPGAIHGQLYLNPAASHPLQADAEVLLQRLQGAMPRPAHDGMNALGVLRSSRYSRRDSFYGNWSVSGNEVKISVRVLTDLLAGRLSLDEFLDVHGREHGWVPIFEQQLRQGRLLTEAVIERVPDRDDDWIVFRFGPPDPAVGPITPE